MATYCKNHVDEEVKRLIPNVKNGAVKKISTKEGTCGHLGGCNTHNLDLCKLEYEYKPAKEETTATEKAETTETPETAEIAETSTPTTAVAEESSAQ